LLVFPVAELPELARGKGNKLIQVPSSALKEGHRVVALTVMSQSQSLRVVAGKRHVTLNAQDLVAFTAERAKRGRLLPRGLQRVDALEVEG
jgi:topoisomerase IV subunit A